MARQPRFSIPTRIFLGYAVVLAAFGALAVLSVVQHDRNARTLHLLHQGYLPLSLKVEEQRATQSLFLTQLDQVHEGPARRWVDNARRYRPRTLERALDQIAAVERLSPPPDGVTALASVRHELEGARDLYGELDAPYNELIRALEAGDAGQAEALMRDIVPRERRVQNHFRHAFSRLRGVMYSAARGAAEQERSAALLLGILTLLALGVGVAVTWWSQRVLKPLPALTARVMAVAEGDARSRPLTATREDELGNLTREFEAMVDALEARTQKLREAVEAQRELQHMQEQIVSGLRAAVVVVDGEGVVRTVNAAARPVLDIGEPMVGRPIEETGLTERLPGLAGAVADVAKGGARSILEAAPVEGASERFVDVLVTPFGTADPGEPCSALIVAEDVTQELRTKARLIHTERLAAIGQMAAHVTHEVRNPLSSIGLNVEMLEEEMSPTQTEARSLLSAIQKEIDRLTGITEEYLRLARLPQPRLEPDDVADLARSVADFLGPEMKAAGVELEVEIDESAPSVAMDEAQIRQALLNLLRNAREAMPGGGRLRFTVGPGDDGVRVRVQDSGVGISDDEREHIFDLFYTTKDRGTGLGLPLTQQIVVAHGGRIRCDGEPGRGTTFELWFPAAEGLAQDARRSA